MYVLYMYKYILNMQSMDQLPITMLPFHEFPYQHQLLCALANLQTIPIVVNPK
jgi:hypothetical protein